MNDIQKNNKNFPKDYLKNAFKYQVEKNHRTVISLVGIGTKKFIPNLHSQLCSISPLNKIIWTYKNSETTLDKSIKKIKISEEDDAFTKWIKMKNPDYILYKEINRILGQTCDMLVIQDFEAITPNIMAAAMETVRGGGIIILLLDQDKSLDQLIHKKTDLHQFIGCEDTFVPRFNKRLFKSLASTNFTIFLDSEMRIMNISNAEIKTENTETKLSENKIESTDTLLSLCKTEGQKEVLISCIERMKIGISVDESEISTNIIAIKAARGRGKSVALAFTVTDAIRKGASSIYISSLYPENVSTLMEFIVFSLEKLGYLRNLNLKVIYSFSGKKRSITKIIVNKNQTIEYFNPFLDLKYYPSLMIIDEAASIPLDFLKKLLIVSNVYMATTVSGYEGTGRVFQTKLADWFVEKNVNCKYLELTEPIRYSKGDPVEAWLNKMLILNSSVRASPPTPLPSECTLFHLNKDGLFSGSEGTENFLSELFSLFISSHYRNSPNDIQLLADSPTHEVFALISPGNNPAIICAIQVSFEGKVDKKSYSKEGNLIPWVLYDNTFNDCILQEYGARIVRIAVHPNLGSMGYGSMAIKILENRLFDQSNLQNLKSVKFEQKKLFNELENIQFPQISWIGASFGLTPLLMNFWRKNEYLPICMKQTTSKTTGEFSIVVIKNNSKNLESFVDQSTKNFIKIFISLLGSSFNLIPPTLALTLIYISDVKIDKPVIFEENDIQRLRWFSKGQVDIKLVLDLIPDVSKMFFYKKDINLISVLQQTILVLVGLQHKSTYEAARFLKIENFDISNLLSKVLDKFFENGYFE